MIGSYYKQQYATGLKNALEKYSIWNSCPTCHKKGHMKTTGSEWLAVEAGSEIYYIIACQLCDSPIIRDHQPLKQKYKNIFL